MDFVGLLIFVGGASYKNCFTIGGASYIYLNYNNKLCSSLYTTWPNQFCECMRQQLEPQLEEGLSLRQQCKICCCFFTQRSKVRKVNHTFLLEEEP